MLQSIKYRCGDRPPPQPPGWPGDEPPKHEPDKDKPEDEKKPEKQQ